MHLEPTPMQSLFEEIEVEHLSFQGKRFFMNSRGKGTPIVFIPGTGGDEKIFARIQKPLSKEFATYAFSHIHLSKLTQVVDAWHKILTEQIGEPFHLLGTSVGGRIVQYYAEKYPEDILSLIIGNSYVDNSQLRKKHNLTTKVARFLPMSMISKIGEKGMLQGFNQYPDGDLAVKFFQTKVRKSTKKEFLTRAKWNLEILPHPRIRNGIPILTIVSNDDQVIEKSTRTHLQEYYSHANHTIIEWGGHFPYIVNPKPYLDALYEFIVLSNRMPTSE